MKCWEGVHLVSSSMLFHDRKFVVLNLVNGHLLCFDVHKAAKESIRSQNRTLLVHGTVWAGLYC